MNKLNSKLGSLIKEIKSFMAISLIGVFTSAVYLPNSSSADELTKTLEEVRTARKERAYEEDQKLGFITGTVYKVTQEQVSFAKGESRGSLSGEGPTIKRGEIQGNFIQAYTASVNNAYIFGLDLEDGRRLGLYVIDADDKKAAAIAIIAEPGRKIVFPAGNFRSCDPRPCYFNEETRFDRNTQIGTKRADRVILLEDKVAKAEQE